MHVTAEFTAEQELEMVEWLRAPEQECLLNKKHPDYINRDLKDALWEAKAREMGKTAEQLRKWYINMRTRFGKMKVQPSGAGSQDMTARDKWILHQFQFLRPHLVVQCKRRAPVGMKAKIQASRRASASPTPPPAATDVTDSDGEDSHPPTPPAQHTRHTHCRTQRTTASAGAAGDTTDQLLQMQHQLLHAMEREHMTGQQHSVDGLVEYLRGVGYELPRPFWLELQCKVTDAIQDVQRRAYLPCPQDPPMAHPQQQQLAATVHHRTHAWAQRHHQQHLPGMAAPPIAMANPHPAATQPVGLPGGSLGPATDPGCTPPQGIHACTHHTHTDPGHGEFGQLLPSDLDTTTTSSSALHSQS